ncbi:hypothetical protein SLS62_011424 [Diatrype stigma]|uniref:Uncharacterized protein n=1 Tax=Diatrype stigma TaxID=117547 RepID=A0AAN9U3V3_9PEZI
MEHNIAPDASFAFLKYGNSSSSSSSPDELSVKRDAYWSYCGPLLRGGEEELPASLHEWASAALSKSSALLPLLLPFLGFVNALVAGTGRLDHYWLTIRATKATDEFDRPRWHTDDMFFTSDFFSGGAASGETPSQHEEGSGQRQRQRQLDLETDWKVCGTLLGPATLFIPDAYQAVARDAQRATKQALATDHACTSIRCVGCAATADGVRARLGSDFARLGAVQAAPGECAFFRIGHDGGAVHSEPSMSGGDRIFVNVVPGKEAELGRLVKKWGMDFPRSWWVAPHRAVRQQHRAAHGLE